MPPNADKKEKISRSTDLKAGDHLLFERDSGYGHHGLVTEVNEKEVTYIHFAPPDDASSSATSLASSGQSSGSSNSGVKGVIHQSTKTLKQLDENKRIFRLHYKVDFSVTEIITRARSRIGKSGYNLFKYNCEHFVRWCRTGTAISYQVDRVITTFKNAIVNNLVKTTARVVAMIIGPKSCGKAVANLVAMMIGPLLRNVAVEVVAEIVERLATMPYGMEILGAVVAAGFELYGFYKYYEEQENKAYYHRNENLIVEGSVRTGRWAGMVFGGILGEKAGGVLGAKAGACAGVILGPVGIAVGCFAGAVVGAAVGTLVGTLLGAGVGGFLRRFAWC